MHLIKMCDNCQTRNMITDKHITFNCGGCKTTRMVANCQTYLDPAQSAPISPNSVLSVIEKVQVLSCNNPQAIILTTPIRISDTTESLIYSAWKERFKGTPLENVPVMILANSMDIKVVDLNPLEMKGTLNEQEAQKFRKEWEGFHRTQEPGKVFIESFPNHPLPEATPETGPAT